LNHIYKKEPALYQLDFDHRGFEWIDFEDAFASTIAFLRKPANGESVVIVACNFTPVPRTNYRLGVPEGGVYTELLNSDSNYYGGSNLVNSSELHADAIPHHNKPFSVLLTLPPLAVVFFKKK
jgi:1,4-alpha-glucan branching enzyme